MAITMKRKTKPKDETLEKPRIIVAKITFEVPTEKFEKFAELLGQINELMEK